MPATRSFRGLPARSVIVLAALFPGGAYAQPAEAQSAARGGLAVAYGAPIGEFSDFVERGWGLGGYLVLPIDRAGVLGVRLDGEYLVYGYERDRVCLSVTVGCRILVDVKTTNSIVLGGLGPELSLPAGPLRPYVNARLGLAYISTSSSLEGTRSGDEPFARTTNLDDVAFSWGAGGGLAVAFSRRVGLDIGVTWLDNGRASYLREGDIVDEPDGGISFDPVRSDTDLVVFRIGVSIGGG